MLHDCGRRLNRTDAVAGLCQACGELLSPAEVSATLNDKEK